MGPDKNTSRLLGIAFIVQALASLFSEQLSSVLIDPENISNTMINISNNTLTMYGSMVGKIITAMGVLLLTILLYTALKKQNKVIARWAFGLRLTEVAVFAVIVMSAFGLLQMSQEYTTAGTMDSSYLVTLGSVFFEAMDYASAVNMLFFSLGALLFYYLFLKSKYIPKLFSVWGLVSTALAFGGTLSILLGYSLNMIVYLIAFLPILPLELGIGIWLTIKGFKLNEKKN